MTKTIWPSHYMTFTDTHTHLYDKEAFEGLQGCIDAVKRAIEKGVTTLIMPDISSGTREDMLELCRSFPDNCFPCLGLHPTEIGESSEAELKALMDRAEKFLSDSSSMRIVAIGEIGLDKHWGDEWFERQKECFDIQLSLAEQHDLPVIIHSRDATEATIDILKAHSGSRGVMHAYCGSIETAREIGKTGDWYFGIGGVLTFKKASIAQTVRDIPLERILLETDSPYLCPAPYRGQRNESAYVPIIANALSAIIGCPIEKIAAQTTENAFKLFGL